MSKIKILYVHHGTGWGGAPINMINIIQYLDSNKFDVHVLLLKNSILGKYLSERNINYSVAQSSFYRKFYSFFLHSDADFISFFQIRKLIRMSVSWILSRNYFANKELKNFDFDILHLNSSCLTDWLAVGKKKGKVVYHIQEPISKGYFGIRYNFFRNQVNKHADLVLAISNDNADRINLPLKTQVVYNFIELPNQTIKECSNKTFLYVGGASVIKGFYTLVNAIEYLNKDIKIILLGDYPLSNKEFWMKNIIRRILYPNSYRLRKSMEILRNSSNVLIQSKVSTIVPYLESSCALISPFSVPHFSRPVIEAFVYGKPVICSDVTGVNEVVTDGVNGFIFSKNDPQQLATKINIMANNPELVELMGENAKASSINYLPESNMNKIINSYSKLL